MQWFFSEARVIEMYSLNGMIGEPFCIQIFQIGGRMHGPEHDIDASFIGCFLSTARDIHQMKEDRVVSECDMRHENAIFFIPEGLWER